MRGFARVSAERLDLDMHVAAARSPQHGAVSVFIGDVRDHDPAVTGEVVRLDYSAHPMARGVIETIADAAEERWECTVAVSHRVGALVVGDAAVIVAAGAAHREAALSACREVIERIKAEAPVWKKETLASGDSVWVGIS